MLDTIKWLGHASFMIEYAGKIIYIDPWEINLSNPADIIFITHSHFDHFSPPDLAKIATQKTYIIAPAGCSGGIPDEAELIVVSPSDEKEILGVKFKAVPAYNTSAQFHPKSNGWVGYLIKLGETVLYHPGDTDLIPEMSDLKVDIALLPITPPYTMDAEDAAEAAKRVKAKEVIPMHYGKIAGSEKDVEVLKNNLPENIKLTVLPLN